MENLRAENLSAKTIFAVNALSLKPGQEQFIVPTSYAAATAVTTPETSWQKVILLGDDVVGFVQGNFDKDAIAKEFRSCLWRINVDASTQGKGIGKFAVNILAEEAHNRGFNHLNVLWERGDNGPENFFLRVGFEPVGETPYGEVIGELSIK